MEKGVVGVDDALRPLEEGGEVTTAKLIIAQYDGWVDVPCLVAIIFVLSSSSSSSSGRGGSIERSVQDRPLDPL